MNIAKDSQPGTETTRPGDSLFFVCSMITLLVFGHLQEEFYIRIRGSYKLISGLCSCNSFSCFLKLSDDNSCFVSTILFFPPLGFNLRASNNVSTVKFAGGI